MLIRWKKMSFTEESSLLINIRDEDLRARKGLTLLGATVFIVAELAGGGIVALPHGELRCDFTLHHVTSRELFLNCPRDNTWRSRARVFCHVTSNECHVAARDIKSGDIMFDVTWQKIHFFTWKSSRYHVTIVFSRVITWHIFTWYSNILFKFFSKFFQHCFRPDGSERSSLFTWASTPLTPASVSAAAGWWSRRQTSSIGKKLSGSRTPQLPRNPSALRWRFWCRLCLIPTSSELLSCSFCFVPNSCSRWRKAF